MLKGRVLTIAGTSDGRLLAEKLSQSGYCVTVSVATALGAEYMQKNPELEIVIGRLDAEGLAHFIEKNEISFVVDASHPFAQEVSKNAMQAAKKTNAIYIRFEREKTKFEYNVIEAESYKHAVSILNNIKGNILLTTGTNNIQEFTKVDEYQKRVFIRILDMADAEEKCLRLGFCKQNIIAKNGPFSVGENLNQIKAFQISALVTKDSGKAGGLYEKIQAAQKAEIQLIVLKRPSIKYEAVFTNMEGLLYYMEGIFKP